MLEGIGLSGLTLESKLVFARSYRDSDPIFRLDAEFYQPKYYRLESAIRKCGAKVASLREFIEPVRNGFDFRQFTAAGVPYIRVGDLAKGRILMEGAEHIPLSIEKVKKNVRLRVGDVLFTRKGSYGNAAVVRKGQEHSVISSEIMLLRPLKHVNILPEYLAVYLNSFLGYQQVERRVHGGAFYSISQPDLGSLLVVDAVPELQERVRAKVLESQLAYDESKRLLERATRTIESLILPSA